MRRRRHRRTILDHWSNEWACACVHLINTRIDLLHCVLAFSFHSFVLSFQLIYELNVLFIQHTSNITLLMHIAHRKISFVLTFQTQWNTTLLSNGFDIRKPWVLIPLRSHFSHLIFWIIHVCVWSVHSFDRLFGLISSVTIRFNSKYNFCRHFERMCWKIV